MQFHDYHTHYQVMRHRDRNNPMVGKGPESFYQDYMRHLQSIYAHGGAEMAGFDPFTPLLMQLQGDWHAAGRPYYNLWPSIIPALSKLRLDADSSFFRLPLDQLLLRFPMDNNPLVWQDSLGQQWGVRAVLAQNIQMHTRRGPTNVKFYDAHPDITGNKRGMAFWIDIGEAVEDDPAKPHDPAGQIHSLLYKHVICEQDRTIEWSFDGMQNHWSSDMGVTYPDSIVRDIARLVCTLCLMAEDTSLVEPIVLKSDEDKYEATGDASLVAKAKRRGNYGFNVGRDIEVAPHVRSASPAALYWTGVGRRVPRIRFRRGTVVHRKRLAQVPTGFLDKDKGNE